MQSSFPEVITDSTSLPPGKAQAWIKVIDGSGIPVTLWSGDVIRHVGLVQFDVLTTSEAHGRRIVEFVGNVLDAQEIELWDGSGVNFGKPRFICADCGLFRCICRVGYTLDQPRASVGLPRRLHFDERTVTTVGRAG